MQFWTETKKRASFFKTLVIMEAKIDGKD